MVRNGFLALAALLVLGAPVRAGAVSVILSGRRVSVTADQQPQGPRAGYLTLPLQLENRTTQPQRVTLRFESRPSAVVEAQVPLAGGERRSFPLLIPAEARFGSLSASDGYEDGHEGFSWHYQPHDPLLLEGPTTAASLGSKPGLAMPTVVVARGDLPELLAGLAGYAAVALLESQLEDLTEPQRRALEAYAATGGDLYLTRYPAHPETLLPLFHGAPTEGAHPYGFGAVHLYQGVESCLQELRRTGDLHRPAASSGTTNASTASSRRSYRYGEPEGESLSAPLLDIAKVPVGGFLVLVLAFVLVIGPGSFVLRARKGPHALLAFIPLTALATCGGIAGYGFFHEGLFTIHAASRSATLLDTERHRAISLSVDGYYASLAPSSEHFGALVVPLAPADGLFLDESDGLLFRSGLVPSRSYREHLVLSVSASRARLSVRGHGEEQLAENALGAQIREGFVRTGARLCRIRDVPDGAQRPLSCQDFPPGDLERLTGALAPRFNVASLEPSLGATLAEGEFLVQLDRSAFAESGGLALEREGDVALVRGRLSP